MNDLSCLDQSSINNTKNRKRSAEATTLHHKKFAAEVKWLNNGFQYF